MSKPETLAQAKRRVRKRFPYALARKFHDTWAILISPSSNVALSHQQRDPEAAWLAAVDECDANPLPADFSLRW